MSKQVKPTAKAAASSKAPAPAPKPVKKPSLLDDDDDDFRMEPKEGHNNGANSNHGRRLSGSELFDMEEFLSLDDKDPLPSYYSTTTTKMENIRKLSSSPLVDDDLDLTDGEETLSDLDDDSPRLSPAKPSTANSNKATPTSAASGSKTASPTQFAPASGGAKNSSSPMQISKPSPVSVPIANKPGAVTAVKTSGKMTTISISQKDFGGVLPSLSSATSSAAIPQPLHTALAAASPYVSAAVAKSLFHKSKSEQSQSSSDDPDWLEGEDMDEDVEDFLLRDDDEELDNDDFLNSVDHLHIK